MRSIIFPLVAAGLAFGLTGARAETTTTTTTDRDGCKVVERKSTDNDHSGPLTSTVTAGGGKVSGSTTGADKSVTVHSTNGSSSSSFATSGSSGGSTVVSGSGNCDR